MAQGCHSCPHFCCLWRVVLVRHFEQRERRTSKGYMLRLVYMSSSFFPPCVKFKLCLITSLLLSLQSLVSICRHSYQQHLLSTSSHSLALQSFALQFFAIHSFSLHSFSLIVSSQKDVSSQHVTNPLPLSPTFCCQQRSSVPPSVIIIFIYSREMTHCIP